MKTRENDICKYNYSIDSKLTTEGPNEDFYLSEDGKYCMVVGPAYNKFVPVFFLDDPIEDLMSGRYRAICPEVREESLEVVIRSK